jgi:hypothetical protein
MVDDGGRRAFLADWPIKLTALMLAVLLWAMVQAREPTTQLVTVSLVVEPPAGRALSDPLPAVRALYAGSARELLKLLDSPPMITKILPEGTGPTVTLELAPDDLVLLTDAQVAAQDVQPRRVQVRLEPLAPRDSAPTP